MHNFRKKYQGDVLKYMWPCAWACTTRRHEWLWNKISETCPEAITYLQENHKHIWSRAKFSGDCKVDYVNNNISECFNNWIKDFKGLLVDNLVDTIRGKIMEKIAMRQVISQKLEGPILPGVLNELKEKSRNLNYTIKRSGGLKAEVSVLTRDNFPWRHAVDLEGKTCSCGQWQISGKPCTHAIAFIGSLRKVKLDDYVHGYYSVERFKATYQLLVNPMVDKSQCPATDPGFEMWPPKLERAAGRPRVKRIKSRGEAEKRGPYQCKRCFQFGHIEKGCREPPTELGDELPPLGPTKSNSRKRKGNATSSKNTPKKSKKAASTNSSELAVQLNPSTKPKSSKRKAKDVTKPSNVPKKSKNASASTSTTLATLSPVSPGPTTRSMAATTSTPVNLGPTTRSRAASQDMSPRGIARRLVIN